MPDSASSHPYVRELARRVLVFDGAMGTNIQRHQPTASDYGGKSLEGCNDHLVLTRPDIIAGIHESFLAVGCDVVETSPIRVVHDGGSLIEPMVASKLLRRGRVAEALGLSLPGSASPAAADRRRARPQTSRNALGRPGGGSQRRSRRF
jgi:hypothetical protein